MNKPNDPALPDKGSNAIRSAYRSLSGPERIGTGTTVFLVLGLVIVQAYHKGSALGFLWSLASFGVGAVVGFLFGFPRTVQQESSRPPKPPAGGKAEASPGAPTAAPTDIEFQHLPSTRLDEISDWLTKIIIGLSLVQYREVAAHFRDCAALFAAGLEGGLSSDNLAFANAVMVYFLVLGFLGSFLLTRLLLPRLLKESDQLALVRKQVNQLEQTVGKEVSELRQKVEAVRIEAARVPAVPLRPLRPVRRSPEG